MSRQRTKVPFHYAEAMHSIFYTPVYTAISRGFCAEEGLVVELYTCPSSAESWRRGESKRALSQWSSLI